MGLNEEFNKISEEIKYQRQLMITEEATKQVSVRPFFRALGYDVHNLNEVQPEYTADPRLSGGERVDYAIKQRGKPIILIEVKSADVVLSENHWRQLHDYFGALDVKFGILTNGLEYRFYTDENKLNIMDKEPFLSINMLALDPNLFNRLEEFTKPRFVPERTAHKLKIISLVEREYNSPSREFVGHFVRRVYSGGRLTRQVVDEFKPMVKQAWRELVDQEITSRLQRHAEDNDGDIAGALETETRSPEPLREHRHQPFKAILSRFRYMRNFGDNVLKQYYY